MTFPGNVMGGKAYINMCTDYLPYSKEILTFSSICSICDGKEMYVANIWLGTLELKKSYEQFILFHVAGTCVIDGATSSILFGQSSWHEKLLSYNDGLNESWKCFACPNSNIVG